MHFIAGGTCRRVHDSTWSVIRAPGSRAEVPILDKVVGGGVDVSVGLDGQDTLRQLGLLRFLSSMTSLLSPSSRRNSSLDSLNSL